MKNETARREIESLDYYLQNHTNDYSEESHTAMMMAIKALEQTQLADGDRAISLNAVKDILKMANMEEFDIVAYRNIMQLPPVTPQPCENAISREKVMMELDKYLAGVEYEKGIDRIIAELPSVTPQRPKGHWIEERNDYGEIQGWHCDKCYEDSGFTTKCKWDFCPNCGADMRGDNT